jgi:hypothetical protein
MRRGLLVLVVALLAVGSDAHAKSGRVALDVLSNRADLVSGGDVLVALRLPAAARPRDAVVRVGRRDVTRAFGPRRAGRRMIGLVKGLRLGRNVLRASLRGDSRRRLGAERSRARVVVVNHPNGGPVFSGPQVQPWKCQESAKDEQCNQPPEYDFLYKPSGGGGLRAYDPEDPPSDVATTTTDQGETVPFIVRIETGYQDRDQYKIAVLYDPQKPFTARRPQPGFNHKLLVTHGASCGITHESGNAPSVTSDTIAAEGVNVSGSSPEVALGRGFAVMSTALNNAGHNCNIVTQAESLVMAKERVIEQYGTLRYTIGTGCSGGSLTQQQVANAYPGIYQGILPQCSYPDAISTGIQFLDYHLLRGYFEDVAARAPQLWTPAQYGLVEGHVTHANAVAADEAFFKNAVNPKGDCVDAELVYDGETNPDGVRCSILDYMINVFGPRPQGIWSDQEKAAGRGFAGIPIGNEGVQYGLNALLKGQITPEQFTDLNHRVGGLDIDMLREPKRLKADPTAVRNAYRSGAINEANHLDKVAIIDLRGPDPGAAHDAYRSWELRARIEREHGTHANHVIWFGPAPLIGDADYTTEALLAMDRWLAAVERDRTRKPLAQKIITNKPEDVQDKCDPEGQTPAEECDAVIAPHVYGTPRMVAGDAITTDNAVCRLKPLDRSAYGSVTFTDEQWGRLQEAFPDGVCDFSKPGAGQQDTRAWQGYQRGVRGEVVYGGRPMGAAPKRSGRGWTSPSFAGWRRG